MPEEPVPEEPPAPPAEQRAEQHMAAAGTAAGKERRCPVCGAPATHAFRPFCSSRCRDVDLSRWLSGVYVLPGEPENMVDSARCSERDGGGERGAPEDRTERGR